MCVIFFITFSSSSFYSFALASRRFLHSFLHYWRFVLSLIAICVQQEANIFKTASQKRKTLSKSYRKINISHSVKSTNDFILLSLVPDLSFSKHTHSIRHFLRRVSKTKINPWMYHQQQPLVILSPSRYSLFLPEFFSVTNLTTYFDKHFLTIKSRW